MISPSTGFAAAAKPASTAPVAAHLRKKLPTGHPLVCVCNPIFNHVSLLKVFGIFSLRIFSEPIRLNPYFERKDPVFL